MKILYIQF